MNKCKDPHFWFLDTLNEDMMARCTKLMKGHTSIHSKRKALYDNMSEIKYTPYEWEAMKSNHQRIMVLASGKLRDICVKHQLKDNELLVVGHAITWACMWGDGWNQWTMRPKKYKSMKNAEFLEYPLRWAPEDRDQIAYNVTVIFGF